MTQRTLLIVDSDVFQQQLIDMLLAVDDYKLMTATSGREALEHLKTITPDLMMLADKLPDTKGADLCARIRGVRRFATTPIILTSSADTQDEIASLVPAVHASLALAKPLGNKRLRDRVRELISSAPVTVSEVRRAVVKPEAPKPQLPQTFEIKDSDTALSQTEPDTQALDSNGEVPVSPPAEMSQEEYVRSILARGSVVPLKEEDISKLSIFKADKEQPTPQATAQATTELDEDLLLTEADLTELTIYTDIDIEPNVSPELFADSEAVVRPAPSFAQAEVSRAEAPHKKIDLENFADDSDVHVTATRPKKLSSSEDAQLVTHTQAGTTNPSLSIDANALLEEKPKRKLSTLIEQPFGASPSKRELSSPKPKEQDDLHSAVIDLHDLADEDTRRLSAEGSIRKLDSQELIKEQELEQMSRQVETLLKENDQLKEAIRELERDQPVGASESYLDAVEELEALRRLTEHQNRQLTKLYGENRYLRERQQEPLKPEPPRKTIWDKLKL